jgi:hypothetical protein
MQMHQMPGMLFPTCGMLQPVATRDVLAETHGNTGGDRRSAALEVKREVFCNVMLR